MYFTYKFRRLRYGRATKFSTSTKFSRGLPSGTGAASVPPSARSLLSAPLAPSTFQSPPSVCSSVCWSSYFYLNSGRNGGSNADHRKHIPGMSKMPALSEQQRWLGRRDGRTGFQVSVLGFGAATISNHHPSYQLTDAEAISAVAAAASSGVTFFDSE